LKRKSKDHEGKKTKVDSRTYSIYKQALKWNSQWRRSVEGKLLITSISWNTDKTTATATESASEALWTTLAPREA